LTCLASRWPRPPTSTATGCAAGFHLRSWPAPTRTAQSGAGTSSRRSWSATCPSSGSGPRRPPCSGSGPRWRTGVWNAADPAAVPLSALAEGPRGLLGRRG
jgi:hypothetical protein